MMRAALLQLTSAVLLSLPMIATIDAQSSAAKPEQKPTTIVGCLVQEAPNVKAKTNDYFVRTPTVAVPVGGTVAVGKPGAPSAATPAGTPARDSYYRITGLSSAQLQPHVNHRVELQGHLSGNAPDASQGVTSTKTTVDKNGKPTVAVETRVDVAGVLHASALKMVDATCK